MKNEIADDVAAERELDQLRNVLIRDEPLPLGMVSRLEAVVQRDQRDQLARQSAGWEARLGIACVCFVALGLWSREAASVLPFGALALLALLYAAVAPTPPAPAAGQAR